MTDVVVVGAGTFGAILAWRLAREPGGPRVLLLDAGGFDRVEHVQTPPVARRAVPRPGTADPVWELPWRSDVPAHGQPLCVGGRSLYWGGSCLWPRLDRWPAPVAAELAERHLPAAAALLGLDRPDPARAGPLNEGLRGRLVDALAAGRIPGADAPADPGRLTMPMALRSGRRFSSAALLSRSDRLELRTGCRVSGLRVAGGRVRAVRTADGPVEVPRSARVVVAAGTVESTRLVLDALDRPPVPLTTHLRSNLTVRVPFPAGLHGGTAALAVRGRHRDASFHHQVTAYGLGTADAAAERLLLDSTPRADIESMPPAVRGPERHLVLTVASVAEMTGPGSVGLLAERDRFGTRRAYVRLAPDAEDRSTWDAVDRSADAVVAELAGGPYEVLRPRDPADRREPLGCTHHEMGTLPLGTGTDLDGRVPAVEGLYLAAPATFPRLDSVGPVLPGAALTLRLAEHLLQA